MAGAILVAFRLHAFDLPLETDECNYIYIGSRLLAGDRLYVDVWDHQPFGVFVLLAGVIALFGDGPGAFRWMAVLFSLASLGLIHAVVRRCAGRGAAITAAFLFALASSDPGTAGEGCNREIYMNTLVLAAWYLALRSEGKAGGLLFASGAALAVGSSVKTILAVHWVLLASWIALAARRCPDVDRRGRSILTSLGMFAAGPALLWVAAFGYFFMTERGDEFVDAVFRFNLSYSGQAESFVERFGQFFSPPRHPFIFDSALPLWLGGVGAILWLIGDTAVHRSRRYLALLLLALGGYLAVCLPARFWPHYYYLLIPALVIALAVAVGQLVQMLRASPLAESPGIKVVAPILYALFPLWLFTTEYDHYLLQPPFGITVNRYNSRDFWGRAQGENVLRVTAEDDQIFVYGNEAEIYYYSKRRCASRFTMITGLQSGYEGHADRRAAMLTELEQRRPRIILVLFDEPPFEAWREFLEEHYERVGADLHDRTGGAIMFVFALRDRAVEPIDWNWDRSAVGGWFAGEKR